MQHEDRVRVQHMLDSCKDAIQFASSRVRSDLDTDRMLLLALVKCIEIIGEAASMVSDTTIQQAADIPWRSIVAMRNRLIHGYFDINPSIVWVTVREEIPQLVPPLEKLLDE